MELLGNNPSMQDLIEKLNEVVGSLNNSLPNTDSEIAEVKKLVSFGSGVLAGRLNAKLWYFKTQELMTASTELCEGDSCFVLKNGATTGEGTFEYWYIYKTSDVVDIVNSYVDLSNPDLVAVKLQDMTLKDVKDTLSAQISDQSKDLNTKISNLRTDTETALSGKADLVNGLIPASQLPSYVDDIIESWLEDIEFPENAYAKEDTEMTTPLTPEFSKIYVNLLNNKTYRWGGNFYVEVSKSLAIGETATTAFAGDRGKILETKIQNSINYVTPEMFGAKGDSTTDDTAAIESALASGKDVILGKDKTYLITRDIQIKGGCVIKNGTLLLKNSTIICEQEIKFDRKGFLLNNLTIIIDDYATKSAIKVTKCFSGTICNVTIKSKTNGINSSWNGLDVVSDSAENGVLFLNIAKCRISGAKIGIDVVASNEGYITSCNFNDITIESFTEMGVKISGSDAFANRFINLNIDDNFSSNVDRYGIYVINTSNNIFDKFNIWADAINGDNLKQFYAIKVSNIYDYSKNMTFNGYAEGIIDASTKYLLKYCKCDFYYAEFNTIEKTRKAIGQVTNTNYGSNKYPGDNYLTSRNSYGNSNNIYTSYHTGDIRLNVHGSGKHGVSFSMSGNGKKGRIIIDCECNSNVTLLITDNEGTAIYSNTLSCTNRTIFTSDIITLNDFSVYVYTESNDVIHIYGLNLNLCNESDFATKMHKELFSSGTPSSINSIVVDPYTGKVYKLSTNDGTNITLSQI